MFLRLLVKLTPTSQHLGVERFLNQNQKHTKTHNTQQHFGPAWPHFDLFHTEYLVILVSWVKYTFEDLVLLG